MRTLPLSNVSRVRAVVLAMLCVGCNDATTSGAPSKAALPPTAAASAPAAPASKPPYTRESWTSAFRSTFEQSSLESKIDGTSEYVACFEKNAAGHCSAITFGVNDAFRRLHHLTPKHSQINRIGDVNTFVEVYVTARECEAPSILLSPNVNSDGPWLFMRKAAVLADGAVIIERTFDNRDVQRESNSGWTHEQTVWIASSSDIQALRQSTGAKSLAIRFSGDSHYVTVDAAKTKGFRDDVRVALLAFDRISKATSASGGPKCG